MFVVPIAQRGIRVDLREQFIEVPSQTGITKDNAPISIDFLIYWRIVDPYRSVVEVQNFNGALQNIATTTLRAVVGDILLDDVLSKREQINEVLRVKLDEVTERWGGKVTTVEIREITPPRDVQDAMNRQLSAERTRRAVITESEGSRQSAINVAEGTKQAEILRAEGDRQAAILRAEGFALALERIFAAASQVDQKTMALQYLEAFKALGAEPVDEVHHPARDHPARGFVPWLSRGRQRAATRRGLRRGREARLGAGAWLDGSGARRGLGVGASDGTLLGTGVGWAAAGAALGTTGGSLGGLLGGALGAALGGALGGLLGGRSVCCSASGSGSVWVSGRAPSADATGIAAGSARCSAPWPLRIDPCSGSATARRRSR